ncbi:MAG TPA: hypothetical protein PLL20_12615 [Phycisphaerae bacterium]|nr:hypothetical protein [Phycisphaerae bacterium]HRR84952.1 hypothetical protein [Phycisphaerae bacterium]
MKIRSLQPAILGSILQLRHLLGAEGFVARLGGCGDAHTGLRGALGLLRRGCA